MDCIVGAGGIPGPGDPLHSYSQGRPKALIDVAGRPMLEWVVDALFAARHVDDVVVVGLARPGLSRPGLDPSRDLRFARPVHHLPDAGSLIANALSAVRWLRHHKPESEHVLLSAADVPALTGAVVDDFVESCRPFDKALYYSFVTREAMEARFPGAGRTYTRLADVELGGGDLALFHVELTEDRRELWDMLQNARKQPWRLIRLTGYRTLFRYLTRRLTLAELNATASRVLGRPAALVASPHAELAMDADRPSQIDQLREDLAGSSVTDPSPAG